MYARLLLVFLLASSLTSLTDANKSRRQSGCTDDDTRNRNFAATYPQCASNLDAFTKPFEITLRDLFCNATCGPLYKSFFFAQCTSFTYRRVVEYYELQCNNNSNGMPCYSFYNDSEIDMSFASPEALQLCNSSIRSMVCSDSCRSQLISIKNYYGSCVNSVFNSSYFQSFGHELLPLFSYQLWTGCGVSVPAESATGVPPTSSATHILSMKFAAIVILALIGATAFGVLLN